MSIGVTAQLVRDGNIGGILSRTTATGAAFYGYDGNGNVTLLTDVAGQDVGNYRYDAFGNTLEADGPRAGENPYRFSTKEFHAQSGLYDYGFRFYSPGMGRWLNRDPLGEDGGVNLYGMVGNNPINSVDSYGLSPDCMHDGIPNSCGPKNSAPNRPPTRAEIEDSIIERGTTVAVIGAVGAVISAIPFLGRKGGAGPVQSVASSSNSSSQVARRNTVAAFTSLLRSRAGFNAKGQAYIIDNSLGTSPQGLAKLMRSQGYNARSVTEIFGKDPGDPVIRSLAKNLGARVVASDTGSKGGGFGNSAINISNRVRSASGAMTILRSKNLRR